MTRVKAPGRSPGPELSPARRPLHSYSPHRRLEPFPPAPTAAPTTCLFKPKQPPTANRKTERRSLVTSHIGWRRKPGSNVGASGCASIIIKLQQKRRPHPESWPVKTRWRIRKLTFLPELARRAGVLMTSASDHAPSSQTGEEAVALVRVQRRGRSQN